MDAALRCDKPRPQFAYIAPYYKQAKAVAWEYLRAAINPLRPLGATSHESELRVDLHNGGRVRLHGADNADALRGIYLDGVVCDEYADWDPNVWPEVVSPTLSDRQGWAVFIGTPKGHNAFYKLWAGDTDIGWVGAKNDPDWYSLMLKASETGLVLPSELAIQRKLKTAEQYDQEYECSFEAAIVGSYYGKLLSKAEEEQRICGVPYDPAARVITAWDIGYTDETAVWFAQVIGKEVHLIDYYESKQVDIAADVRAIQNKDYNYSAHILPHDAWATSKQTGKTTAQMMQGMGLKNIERAPNHAVEDGITAASLLIPRCWFDQKKTVRGVEALKMYRSEYDDKRQTLRTKPLHDWSSHAADAFRYLAMSLDNVGDGKPIKFNWWRGGPGSWMGG